MKHLLFTFITLSLLTAFPILAGADATDIAENNQLIRPLLPGQTIDNVCLQDINKQEVCTDDLFAQKPSVLIVYRGGWCPYCNAQLNQIKQVEKGILQLGYQIIAMSPDSNKNITEQQKRENIDYPLLTDNELTLSKELGLAYFLAPKTAMKYKNKLGVPFIDIKGEDRVALPAPAIYIIDKKGMVHFQYVNPDFKVRLNEKLLLSAARLLKADLD